MNVLLISGRTIALLFRGVVFPQIEIDPGRGLIQIPVAGRNNTFLQLNFFTVFFQSGICPDINTLLLVRINFTPSLKTSAAGSITLILRTLRHRTEVGRIDEGAVPAVFAIKEHDLG